MNNEKLVNEIIEKLEQIKNNKFILFGNDFFTLIQAIYFEKIENISSSDLLDFIKLYDFEIQQKLKDFKDLEQSIKFAYAEQKINLLPQNEIITEIYKKISNTKNIENFENFLENYELEIFKNLTISEFLEFVENSKNV